jgi:hypothetical protein
MNTSMQKEKEEKIIVSEKKLLSLVHTCAKALEEWLWEVSGLESLESGPEKRLEAVYDRISKYSVLTGSVSFHLPLHRYLR